MSVWLLVGLPLVARAQTADSEFARGLLALRTGQLSEAAAAFEASYRLGPKPETMLNLGVVRTRQGRLGGALEAFGRYLTDSDPVRDAANIQAVRAEVARIRATSTTLVMRLDPPDATVRVDGTVTPTVDGELVLTPGEHALDIRAPGRAPYADTINMPAGRFSMSLRLAAAQGPTPPPPQPTAPAPAESISPAAVATDAGAQSQQAPAGADVAEGPAPVDTAKESVDSCLLGNACLALAATAGVPNALGAGVALRLPPYFSLAADAQFLPTITVEGADVNSQLFSIMGRVHPWENGLFAGIGVALLRIHATVDRSVAVGTADIKIPTLAFSLGYASEGEGFFVGIDASLLVEIYETKINTPEFEDPAQAELAARLDGQVRDAVAEIKELLPFLFQVNLIRIGYAF